MQFVQLPLVDRLTTLPLTAAGIVSYQNVEFNFKCLISEHLSAKGACRKS